MSSSLSNFEASETLSKNIVRLQFDTLYPDMRSGLTKFIPTNEFEACIKQFENLKLLTFNKANPAKVLYVYELLNKKLDVIQCAISQDPIHNNCVVLKGPNTILLSSEFVEFKVKFSKQAKLFLHYTTFDQSPKLSSDKTKWKFVISSFDFRGEVEVEINRIRNDGDYENACLSTTLDISLIKSVEATLVEKTAQLFLEKYSDILKQKAVLSYNGRYVYSELEIIYKLAQKHDIVHIELNQNNSESKMIKLETKAEKIKNELFESIIDTVKSRLTFHKFECYIYSIIKVLLKSIIF